MSDWDTHAGALLGPVLPGASKAASREARNLAELTPEEVFTRCADAGDADAWDEFMRRFHPLIVSIVRRTAARYTGAYNHPCDDLTQEVYLKLNANDRQRLREFVPRHAGAVYGYISVITANVVHDYFTGIGRIRPEDALPDNLPAPDDIEARVFGREIDDWLRQNTSEINRRIFWLKHRHGLTAKDIAALPGIPLGVKGVESVLKRLADLIRKQFGRGEGK